MTHSESKQPDALPHGRTVLPRVEGGPAPGAPPALTSPEGARFAPLRPLGEGGMGEVHLVEDRDIRRHVAVKRIKPGQDGPDVVVRFIDEIRTIGQLDHPGVAPIHDVGIDEAGRYYFIMKYVEGEALDKVIERLRAGDPAYQRRFSIEVRTQIFLQVLRVVEFAHSKGILHRDLKPANIMVGPYGEVMVIDWGLARRMAARGTDPTPVAGMPLVSGPPDVSEGDGGRASQTRHGALIGTPAYMSPEQIQGDGDSLDERSDIYSLCALLYELLTLQHYLTPKESVQALLGAIMFEEAPGAITIHHRYGVPPELAHYVRKGLHKDRAARYQSVREMIDALQAINEGEMPVQCPCTGIKRAGGGFSHFIDGHPNLAIGSCILGSSILLYGLARLAMDLAALLR
jgi:eukaryotic-like serine/threonine-protein kinase